MMVVVCPYFTSIMIAFDGLGKTNYGIDNVERNRDTYKHLGDPQTSLLVLLLLECCRIIRQYWRRLDSLSNTIPLMLQFLNLNLRLDFSRNTTNILQGGVYGNFYEKTLFVLCI